MKKEGVNRSEATPEGETQFPLWGVSSRHIWASNDGSSPDVPVE